MPIAPKAPSHHTQPIGKTPMTRNAPNASRWRNNKVSATRPARARGSGTLAMGSTKSTPQPRTTITAVRNKPSASPAETATTAIPEKVAQSQDCAPQSASAASTEKQKRLATKVMATSHLSVVRDGILNPRGLGYCPTPGLTRGLVGAAKPRRPEHRVEPLVGPQRAKESAGYHSICPPGRGSARRKPQLRRAFLRFFRLDRALSDAS